MANVNPWRTLGAIEFVEINSRRRAMTYRERAANLSTLADTEPNASLRTKLLELATQYEELAKSLSAVSGGEMNQTGLRGVQGMKREPRVPTLPLQIFEQYLRHLRGEQARLLAERERYVSGDGRRDMTAEVIAQVNAEIANIEGTIQALTVEQEPRA